jgi:hypothetical protein
MEGELGNQHEDKHKTLFDLVDNNRTDKNTWHSYLYLYEKKFHDIKYKAKNILEIGIGNGGSIKLWHDYFVNSNIYALDISDLNILWDGIKHNDRIKLITSTDAYNEDFFNNHFLNKNMKFDILLDDGPHTLESMKQFITLYTKVMAEDGILIIEDVQHINWIQELIKVVPEHLKKYIEVYDLRHVKQRYDDIVFVIHKKNNIYIYNTTTNMEGELGDQYEDKHKTLFDLVDNNRTDKNTIHSYLDLYEKKFHDKKNKAKNVLEIGIGPYKNSNGGSIKLWHDYFVNANVYALDVLHIDNVWDDIKNNDRIKLVTSTDAYNEDFFNNHFLYKNMKFDVLLDDGPHTLESMKQFITLYTNVMAEDGILVIEDVQHIDWIQELAKVVPEHLKRYIEVYDLRHMKQRYDDIVFVIHKQK